jgi:glycosyltransferase involved in cell wall biosynthesis
MKITFVLPTVGISGGIRVASIYADLLQKRGHDVCVVSPPPAKPSIRQQLRSLLKGKGWISSKPSPSYFDDLAVPHHVIDTYRPIADHDVPDADVVIATWWETAEWVAALSARKGAKAYFIQHHEVHEYLPCDRVNATWTLPMHKITIAQWLVDLARDQFGDTDVSLVPNTVDPTKFYAEPRGKQAVPTVGVMHSNANWKGCDVSYAAFERARAVVPNLRLKAFGMRLPGDGFPEGAEFIQSPNQEQLRSLYSQCDAWLFGSRFEGFGLPILEAMACRTPVVGTKAGAAPEFIQDDAGVLVDIDDVEAMAEGIIRIAQMSEAEWNAMSDCAYQRATENTWDDSVVLFEQALERAIARSSNGFLGESLPQFSVEYNLLPERQAPCCALRGRN